MTADQHPPPLPRNRWYHKLVAVFFVLFCIELGVFLTLVPWTPMWEKNSIAFLSPEWRHLWLNPYFRGAMSGIGILNLWIAFLELVDLRRYWIK